MKYSTHKTNGFSLVEVIVVAAVSTLIFGALFVAFQYTINLMNESRARLSALSLANDRLEYIRSLPYNDVGTIAGIPPGAIPQNSTTTLNGIVFAERVLIEYVDDPADGQDTATTSDSNGISSDYKRVKVEYTWTIASSTNSISMVTSIVPRSIETTIGGGTVRINVIDANSLPLPGASVRLVNSTGTSTIDVTRFTDSSGTALISGAPANSNYEVFVTATIGGRVYSTSQTYQPTAAIPNPVLGPFSVLESDISTLTFQIGELSDLDFVTLSDLNEGSVLEDFTDLTGASGITNVAINAGSLVLSGAPGSYVAAGSVYLAPIAPAGVTRWGIVRIASDLPSGTNFVLQLYTEDGAGGFVLIPDSELPGNAAGFTDTLVDISALDAGSYPVIIPGISLTTTTANETPRVSEIELFYRTGEVALPGVTLSVRGEKQIGTNASGTVFYKFNELFTTDGSGEFGFNDVEFDTYTLTPEASYDIATVCSDNPFVHEAGVASAVDVVLVPAVTHSLRVRVTDVTGRAVPGAEVTLSRGGFSETLTSNSCGQVFFNTGLTPGEFTLEVFALPYTTTTINPVTIGGSGVQTVLLLE